jgi:tryptophanyl-tRNA synthetase
MLVDAINELLAPVRRRRAELADDASYLDDVLDAGNARAREIADKTLADVHEAIGMAYANRRRAVSTCSGRDVV